MKRMDAYYTCLWGGALLLAVMTGCKSTQSKLVSRRPLPQQQRQIQPPPQQQVYQQQPVYHQSIPQRTESVYTPDPEPLYDIARAEAYADQANEKLTAGDLDAALALFEQAIAENPKMVEAHMGIGGIYHQKGDYESAAAAYERATEIAPTSFDAHYYLGLMRQLLGQFTAATKAYLYALAINPNDFNANQDLASCYLQMGRPAEAVPYARKATELEPRIQSAWANLGAAYSLIQLHDKAIRAYREASELGELQDPILLGLAEAHSRMGNYDQAIAVLKTALKQNPTALSHERMGYALFKKRKVTDALKHFRAALMFDPDDAAALNGLGVCLMTRYIQTNRQSALQKEEAIGAWQRSMQLVPNQPKISALLEKFSKL